MPSWDMVMVANPVAGSGQAKIAAKKVKMYLDQQGMEVVLRFTQSSGEATTLASQAVQAGVSRVVACGGDGTVHEVANALAGSPARLGIIPCGRGNDFARVLGIPKSTDQVAQLLASDQSRVVDMGRIGERMFCTVATLGFDSEVAQTIREKAVPFEGTLAYILGVLKHLITYQGTPVRLTGDFGIFEGNIFLVATANTTTYGGGMQIVPNAVCDDGRLNVCIVSLLSRYRVLMLLPRVFSGSHVDHPAVRIYPTRQLRIDSATPRWIYADGEPICVTPATIEVVQRTLTVICPPSG